MDFSIWQHRTSSRTFRRHAATRALTWLVFRIDDRLRARHRIFEFSRHPRTIFRMQVRAFDQDVRLSDTTRVFAGECIIDLHLWNEHLPLLDGGSLRWARSMNECLQASLCELATFLAATRDLDDVAVIRASMGFGTAAQTEQLARISGRFGFEPIRDPRPLTRAQRLHRLGENVLISLMVLGSNGMALRPDSLGRSRVQVFLSRRALMELHASGMPHFRHVEAPA